MGPPALPRAAREIDRHQPFRLRAQALLHQSDGENRGPCKWSRRRAGERSIDHVDVSRRLAKVHHRHAAPVLGPRAEWVLSLKSVKPESSISVPVADGPSRWEAARADGSAQPGSSIA